MNLQANRNWREIDAALSDIEGLPGVTSKVEIGDHDLYIKMSWFKGKVVHIDITLSHSRGDEGLPVSERQATLETTRYDLARSWVENSCRMASSMLQTGEVEIEDIIEEWKGVSGYPQGYCRQLPGTNPETGEKGPTFQCGPLHAAAMMIKTRLGYWTEFIEALTNDA